MKRVDGYSLDVSVSVNAYTHKPNGTDYSCMRFNKQHLSLNDFISRITQGHSFCHIYKNNHRSNSDFLYTYIICVDVDDYMIPMQDFINGIETHKPTFAYTTFSNGTDGQFSFRLVYCFDSRITSEFEELYFAICAAVGLRDNKDNCGRVKAQLMNGNSLPDVQVYQSKLIYSVTDFMEQGTDGAFEESESFAPDMSMDADVFSKNMSDMEIDSRTVVKDLLTDTNGFIAKYSRRFRIITESELHYNESGYCLLGDDYLKLFDWIQWNTGKPTIRRFKDGEKRRFRLYIDGCIIRKIKSDICFGELLYNLVVRRDRYYDNSDGVLTNKRLI